MATRTNRLNKANPLKLGRRFGSGLKKSDSRPNAPVPASQRGAASGASNTPEETNSSESRIVLPAEHAGLNHCSDAKHALGTPSNKAEGNSIAEIDFAELKDGTLVELEEAATHP